MNDYRRGRSFLRGDFIFVCPTAVIGHCFPLKHFLVQLRWIFRTRNRRIVDQHQDRFAVDIDIFVIIPPVFGCDDTVTDKYDIGIIDLDLRLQPR